MPISVACPHCNTSFRAKDEHAGKRGRCPKCRCVIQIPEAPPGPGPAASRLRASADDTPASETAAAQTRSFADPAPAPPQPGANPTPKEILEAFRSVIQPVEVPSSYRLGTALVLVAMVILPLIYLGLIALVIYGMYLHAVHGVAIFGAVGSGGSVFYALLIYLAPLVIGVICILFMVKPLFARPGEGGRIRSLTRRSDPVLFAFVARVCEAVHAPEPRRIDVDCQVNASAHFRRGLLSMVFSNDLVLTIGMPLVAGLNLRQFAGVLAHEFGHFAQGTGMRLSYIIYSINVWFARVVYQRDEWDARLERWTRQADMRIALIFHLARPFIWLTRRILWLLMIVGHFVSGFMSRQREFDADRYQARLAGSEVVGPTLQRLALLSVAHDGARADLADFYSEGRLADNLPRLIMANIEHITPEMAERVRKLQDEEASGWFDTHPAYKDRVASARQEQAPGVFQLECPATVLFSNFDALSRDVTWDLYRHVFGPQFQASEMHPVGDLLARQSTELEANKALGRFFPGRFHTLRPPQLPDTYLDTPDDPRQVVARLKRARQQVLDAAAAYSRDCELFLKADQRGIEAAQAAALLSAGFKVLRNEFSTPLRDRDATQEALADTLRQQRQLAEGMQPYEQAAGQRLLAGLTLLHAPQVAAKIEYPKQTQRRSAQLLSALEMLTQQYRALFEVRNHHAALAALLSRLEGNEEDERLIKALLKRTAAIANHLRQLRNAFARHRYPFDHAKGEITIGHYLVENIPPNNRLPEVFETSETLLERLPSLYCRILGRLVTVAETVERTLGLDPLPKPPSQEDPPPATSS